MVGNGLYKHKKSGELYRVIGMAKDGNKEKDNWLVIYRKSDANQLYYRTEEDFLKDERFKWVAQ